MRSTDMENDNNVIKTLIIGGGPAGYTAAIYASRANLNPVLIEGLQPGGQLTTTTDVENFPGYPDGIAGPQLVDDIKRQATRFGADIRQGNVSSVNFSKHPLEVNVNGETIKAHTVIIATGATARYLGLEDEQKFMGMGVSACATCDGFFYRNRVVAVVGGGDSACEEALYLSSLSKKVYLIVRKPYLRASKVMQDRVLNKENITVLFSCETLGLLGTDVLEGAKLIQDKGTDREQVFDIAIDGFFLAIGHTPNTAPFKEYLDLDEQGYIKLMTRSSKTNVRGVFAAGDVADPHYQQAITAAAMGCQAALDAEQYIVENQL